MCLTNFFHLYSEVVTRELEDLPWFIIAGNHLNIIYADESAGGERKGLKINFKTEGCIIIISGSSRTNKLQLRRYQNQTSTQF